MKKKMILYMALLMAVIFVQPLAVYAEEAIEAEEVVEAQEEYIYPTDDLEDPSRYMEERTQEGEIEAYETSDETQLFFELERRVRSALLAGEDRADIRDLEIDSRNFPEIEFVYFSPYFCDMQAIAFDKDYETGLLTEIWFAIAEGAGKAHALAIDEEISEILSYVSDGMSEQEKALAVHDYIVSYYEYDYENYKAGTSSAYSHRSGGLIKHGTAVCEGYAYAYKYIMNLLGMDCSVVSSNEMNHAWNIIKIDGEYYHVDCTWDDPVYDTPGRAIHKNFLLSDDMIRKEQKHYGEFLTKGKVCSSTKYDNAYWRNVTSPIIYSREDAFYTEGSTLYKQNRKSQSRTPLVDNLGKWYVWGSQSWYSSSYSGLFLAGNELYYNTASEIRKISLDGQKDVLVYRPDEHLKNGYIYGIRKKQEKIEYWISKESSCANKSGNIYIAPVTLKKELTGIALNRSFLQMNEGESFTLEPTLFPQGVKSNVKWSTSNSKVVRIENGKVMASGAGEAIITAVADNGKKATCKIIVKKVVTGITLNRDTLQLKEDETFSLEYKIEPQGATTQVTWEISDGRIAAVKNGFIRAGIPGEAIITATTDNGKKATCKLTVTKKDADNSPNNPLPPDDSADDPTPSDDLSNVYLPFVDVNEGDWYCDAAKFVYSREIMTGMNETEFGSGVKLSRAQFATILYRMQGRPEVWYDWEAFPDVADGQFYTEAVMWAKDTGIITGYEDGRFGPSDNITREQMALMMFRYANYLELDTSDRGDLSVFPDMERVSGFAWESVEWAVGKGLITGDQGRINPQGSAERGQCAMIIMRFLRGYGL